ncbi:hypothetical protein BH09DEP1_BH09DEP1_0620 [soil metagenome]
MKYILLIFLAFFVIATTSVNSGAMQTELSTKFCTTLELIHKVDVLEKTAVSQEYLVELRQLVHRYQQFCTPEKEHLADFKEHPNLALLLAAERGNYEVIPDLISLGADVNTTTDTMPLFKLKSENNEPPVKVKFSKEHRRTVLMIAAASFAFKPIYFDNSLNQWTMCLDQGEPREEHSEFIKQLIKAGAKVDEQTDFFGMTALHFAVVNFNMPTIKALVKNGASLNIPDHNGMTPLHLAVDLHAARKVDERVYLTKEIVSILLEHGADKTIRTRSGRTARDMAVEQAVYNKNKYEWLNETVKLLSSPRL